MRWAGRPLLAPCVSVMLTLRNNIMGSFSSCREVLWLRGIGLAGVPVDEAMRLGHCRRLCGLASEIFNLVLELVSVLSLPVRLVIG